MNNTIYYAAELMVYFEKTRFLDILRALLIKLTKDRPRNLRSYVRDNLRKIANTILTKTTIVQLPPGADPKQIKHSISKTQNISCKCIVFNRDAKISDRSKLTRRLKRFDEDCQRHRVRNKIFLTFPENYEDVLQIKKCQITPTNVIVITQKVFNSNDDLAAQIIYKIKYSPIPISHAIGSHYVYKAVFIGRRGSGRQTQAKLLAERYNSVYINVESLIEQTLLSNDNMGKVLSIGLEKQNQISTSAVTALVWKRLLKPDTLKRGWVIVNFPKSLNELKTLVEKFQTPPNRFVILHCAKGVALRRLIIQWETSNDSGFRPENTVSHVEKQFMEYDRNIKSVYSYLKMSEVRTIHVEGKGCSLSIKNKIFALLER